MFFFSLASPPDLDMYNPSSHPPLLLPTIPSDFPSMALLGFCVRQQQIPRRRRGTLANNITYGSFANFMSGFHAANERVPVQAILKVARVNLGRTARDELATVQLGL